MSPVVGLLMTRRSLKFLTISPDPVLPSRRWVHPCKCTLIAHEDCLLEWIRTAEQNPRKKEDQVLKCPQCGAQYEMVSEQTSMLRFMERGNRVLSISGRLVTVCTIGSVAVAIASGAFVARHR